MAHGRTPNGFRKFCKSVRRHYHITWTISDLKEISLLRRSPSAENMRIAKLAYFTYCRKEAMEAKAEADFTSQVAPKYKSFLPVHLVRFSIGMMLNSHLKSGKVFHGSDLQEKITGVMAILRGRDPDNGALCYQRHLTDAAFFQSNLELIKEFTAGVQDELHEHDNTCQNRRHASFGKHLKDCKAPSCVLRYVQKS